MVRGQRVRNIPALAVSSLMLCAFSGDGQAACTDQMVAPSGMACGGSGGPLADALSAERANTRLSDKPWIAETWQSAPFMVKQSAPAYTVRTSLSHFFTYDAYRRIAHGSLVEQGLTQQELTALVRSAAAKAPVDVWTTLDFDPVLDEGLIRGGLGADVKLGRGSVVGVAFERGEFANGDDERVITYFKRRIATGLTWRVQGGWGTGFVEETDRHGVVQNGYLNAGLEKTWTIDGLNLSPSVDVGANVAQLEADEGLERWVDGQIVLAQRVSRSFEVGGDKRLEPFLVITQSIDGRDGTDAGRGLESGLKLDQQGRFSFSASTAIKQADAVGQGDVSGKVQLKVPLN